MIWWSAVAWAHRPGLSYAQVAHGELVLTFAAPELADRFTLEPLDTAGLAAATVARATVMSDGVACTLGPANVALVEADGIQVSAALTCPPGENLVFEAPYLADFPLGHRQYLEADGRSVAVLDVSRPSASFTREPSQEGSITGEFFVLGVEHIVTGFDHLAFLLALLLAAKSLRDMALIVSGFTIAHSITLVLAALEVVHLSPALVEPAIALSIAAVAFENFWDPPVRRRLAITFGLGLIHGFGFAGILQDLGLPTSALAWALVSFNVGVEFGQLALVVLVLPMLVWARKFDFWRERGTRVVSSLLALAGLAWFVERIAASS